MLKQSVRIGSEPETRHQVFEGRSGPGTKYVVSTIPRILAAQLKPAFLRDIVLRNRPEDSSARLRSQQVIVAFAQAAFTGVIADREHSLVRIVEKSKIHLVDQQFRAGGE